MMSLNLLSLLGFRLCTRLRAPDHPPETSEKSEVFLLSEDIIKAGYYTLPASINRYLCNSLFENMCCRIPAYF